MKEETIDTRDLPRGAKVKCTLIDVETEEKSEEVLTYDGMDGMYGKFIDKEGNMINASGKLKEIDDGLYIFTDE